MLSSFLLLMLAMLSSPALGWWCNGHMTIAQAAKSQLSSSTLSYIEAMLKTLSDAGPFPMSTDFVQTACWADDLKSDGLTSMASWHFYNGPYSPDGTPPTPGVLQKENVASVTMQMDDSLKHRSKGYILRFALANLIHFYGDSHQPLHTIELFSKDYPDGDRGGNAEEVYVNGTRTRLHFIWDSVCWKFPNSYDRPLSATNRRLIEEYASYLLDQYKFSDAQVDVYNATVFALEGYADAIKYSYPMDGKIITGGAHISQKYLDTCLPVAEGRLALSGLRLGKQLEYLLKDAQQHDVLHVARRLVNHVDVQRHHALRFGGARGGRRN